ncbi:MAG: hypothetical protein HDT30_00890 [Clostridiales bacterium]|nr:hypothetical protein [Clostridiales bacterium]
MTLIVNMVCDMVVCDDAVISDELNIQFREDVNFQCLGNINLNDGINNLIT